MSTAKWFYRTLGEEFGPVTQAALQEMISSGQLGRSEEVREETSRRWITAEQMLGTIEPEHASSLDLDMMLSVEAPVATKASSKVSTGLSLDDIDLVAEAPSGSRSTAAPAAAKIPRWYCRILGEQVGPFDFATMCVMVRAGHIKPTDRVRLEDEMKWLTADGVEGLFDGIEIKTESKSGIFHMSPQRGVSESAVMESIQRDKDAAAAAEEEEEAEEAEDSEEDFELKPQPEPKKAKKKPGSAKKPAAAEDKPEGKAKGKSTGKPLGKAAGKGKGKRQEEVDPMDYLSEPEEEAEDEDEDDEPRPSSSRSGASRLSDSKASMPRTAPSANAATQYGADTAPNLSMSSAAPPPRPAYAPPPPPPRPAYTPPKRSSSGSSVNFKEMFESPVVKGIAAVVVLAPVLWFGWNNLGNLSGGALAKGDKYYYELTEGVYLALKSTTPDEFEATGGWVDPLLKEIEEGTDPSDNLGKLLNQCATDYFPKVVSGKFKEKDKNLEPIEKALEEAKAML